MRVFDKVASVCLVKTNLGRNFKRDYILAKIFNIKLPRRVCYAVNYVFLRYLQVCELPKPVKFDFKTNLNLLMESCLQLSVVTGSILMFCS